MTSPWAYLGPAPSWAADGSVVTLVEGPTFCISAQNGDIIHNTVQGLYFRDIRLLSHWELLVDGQRVEALSVVPKEPFSQEFVCTGPAHPNQRDSAWVVRRARKIGRGLREEISLHNYSTGELTANITLLAATDFADVFTVKERRVHELTRPQVTTTQNGVEIWSEDRELGTLITANGESTSGNLSVHPSEWGLTFNVTVKPGGQWSTSIGVVPVLDGQRVAPRFNFGEPVEKSVPVRRATEWRESTARLSATHSILDRTLQQSRNDLGALRLFYPEHSSYPTIAAGSPWFMTLFGRDALLTSLMAMPLNPEIAIGTAYALAATQGREVFPITEEEPGRILHEIRRPHGSGGEFSEGNFIYYGAVDSTPLFVMLIGELYRWGFGDAVRPLLSNVDRAISWMEEYGDRDGDGFIEYQRPTPSGLPNQGWKDDINSISFREGRLAERPIALAEVQGYAYAAYMSRATIAIAEGDLAGANKFKMRAKKLQDIFNDRFWIGEGEYLALALDKDKKQVDAKASNMGHCLWTRILTEDKARMTGKHLLAPDMFTGWGIRTLSTQASRHNPASYHTGSVWPHDTAISIAGLMIYNLVEEAHQIINGLIDSAEYVDFRLPELFCGFDRSELPIPIAYPAGCSPQAWSAAAPLLMVRAMLRLEPNIPSGIIQLAPELPPKVDGLSIEGLRLGDDRMCITVRNGHLETTGKPTGSRLVQSVENCEFPLP